MAVVVEDHFNGAGAATELQNWTPDTTGTGWTRRVLTGTRFLRVTTSGNVEITSNANDSGELVTAEPSCSVADCDVEIDQTAAATDDNSPLFLIARFADTSNYYAGGRSDRSADSPDVKIYKVVSGVKTQVASGDGTWANGDSIKFELRGSALKVYRKASGGSYVQALSTTDSDITAAGFGGLAAGVIVESGGNMNQAVRLDNFILTEFAAGETASPGAGALTFAGLAASLGFTILMPDEL